MTKTVEANVSPTVQNSRDFIAITPGIVSVGKYGTESSAEEIVLLFSKRALEPTTGKAEDLEGLFRPVVNHMATVNLSLPIAQKMVRQMLDALGYAPDNIDILLSSNTASSAQSE